MPLLTLIGMGTDVGNIFIHSDDIVCVKESFSPADIDRIEIAVKYLTGKITIHKKHLNDILTYMGNRPVYVESKLTCTTP